MDCVMVRNLVSMLRKVISSTRIRNVDSLIRDSAISYQDGFEVSQTDAPFHRIPRARKFPYFARA